MSLTDNDLATIKTICLDILLRYIFLIWFFAGLNFCYVWLLEESKPAFGDYITNYAADMPFNHSVVAFFTAVYYASFKKYTIKTN